MRAPAAACPTLSDGHTLQFRFVRILLPPLIALQIGALSEAAMARLQAAAVAAAVLLLSAAAGVEAGAPVGVVARSATVWLNQKPSLKPYQPCTLSI